MKTTPEQIFAAKKRFHRSMARLPFEEKMLILEELCALAIDVKRAKAENDLAAKKSPPSGSSS